MQIEIPIARSLKLEVTTVVSEMFSQNAFILRRSDQNSCLVIDPSFEADSILKHLAEHDYEVSAILNTHGHIDHIIGNQTIKDRFPAAPSS